MSKQYYKFNRFIPRSESEKSYSFEKYTGYCGSGHEQYMWIPKSAVIVGEVNDVGVRACMIEKWIFTTNRMHPSILREMDYCGNTEI